MKHHVKSKRMLIDLVVVLFLALLFSGFSLAINLMDKIYSILALYSQKPLVEFVINLVFLLIAGTMWLAFRRWKCASRKQAELESIISSIDPDTLLVIDKNRHIVACNNSVKRMFGYEVDEIIDKRINILYPPIPYDLSWWHAIFSKVERDGYHIGTIVGRKKDGEAIYLEIIGNKLGNYDETVLLLRDITEKLSAKDLLRDSQQTLNDIMLAIPLGLFIYQYQAPDKFLLLDCNKEAERMTSIVLDDSKGKDFNKIWPNGHKTRFIEAFQKVLKTQRSIVADEICFNHSNIERVLKVHIFCMPKSKVGVAIEDITNQKLIEEVYSLESTYDHNLSEQNIQI
ncbi:PAS domain S-box protein [bacterium]|nr:PAS domain S-box protein [bacterium]